MGRSLRRIPSGAGAEMPKLTTCVQEHNKSTLTGNPRQPPSVRSCALRCKRKLIRSCLGAGRTGLRSPPGKERECVQAAEASNGNNLGSQELEKPKPKEDEKPRKDKERQASAWPDKPTLDAERFKALKAEARKMPRRERSVSRGKVHAARQQVPARCAGGVRCHKVEIRLIARGAGINRSHPWAKKRNGNISEDRRKKPAARHSKDPHAQEAGTRRARRRKEWRKRHGGRGDPWDARDTDSDDSPPQTSLASRVPPKPHPLQSASRPLL